MAIENSFFDSEYWTVTCDGKGCATEEEDYSKQDGWGFMLRNMKEYGWTMRKDAQDQFMHFCPTCSEDVMDQKQ